ncbi:hypothetical protein N9Z27_02480 [Alphaproteobacteria bacterium]|nr:hypothetical protein [Alphaproteobacteria bacterium]
MQPDPFYKTMEMGQVKSIHQDWLNLSPKDAFSNSNQKITEAWVTMKMCEALRIAPMFTFPTEEPADILLKYEDKEFKVQVTECREEEARITVRDALLGEVFGERNLTPFLLKTINKKEKKKYSNASELILLIYLNIKLADLASGLDYVRHDELEECCRKSQFLEVVVYHCGKLFFLKKSKLYEIYEKI